MATAKNPQQLPERDKVLVRPDEPLPPSEDPKPEVSSTADPKQVSEEGQGTDPRRDELDYSV